MSRRTLALVFLLLGPVRTQAAPAVLVDDTPDQTTVSHMQVEGSNASFPDVYELREKKRVGVGASFLGWSGFIAANLELNIDGAQSAQLLVGGGPGYQSVGVGYKWLPMETPVHPIFGFGLVDWFGSLTGSQKNPSPPSFLSERVITDSDRSRGQFSHLFFAPSLGVEWTQLSGPGMGAGLYAQIMLLMEQQTFDQYLTATTGVVYYF